MRKLAGWRLCATSRGVILALASVLVACPAFAAQPQVTLAQGALAGAKEGKITVFRGIPFAGNTGGDHRWRPPTAPPHWQGKRDASHFGPVCPQPAARFGKPVGWLKHFKVSEDCLNLSVYTPSLQPRHKLPVMVWVHGGGARVGSGSLYDGSQLAARGVVVVTLNYRLGLLGRFAYPGLDADRPNAPRGNYGLMDVLAGLKWVKHNIASFGGDPHNVTLFGQSSGSVAVVALMSSPMSKGLFQRAIAQSGVPLQLGRALHLKSNEPGMPSLEGAGARMAKVLLPDDKTITASDLRGLPWQAIVKYQKTLRPGAMMPAVDGKILVKPVGLVFAQGKQQPIPLLIGTVSWEQSLFAGFHLPPISVIARGVPGDEIHANYPHLKGQALVRQWLADTQFNAPVRWIANANTAVGQPTWVYQFDHLSPAAIKSGQPGAAHEDDVQFLFDVLGKPARSFKCPGEVRMMNLMLGYWTRFARTGNPNGSNLPDWPRWTSGGQGATELLNVPVRYQQGLMKRHMTYQLGRFARMARAAGGQRPAPAAESSK